MTEWLKVDRKIHDFSIEKEFIGTFLDLVPSLKFEGKHDILLKNEAGQEILVFGKTALVGKFKGMQPITKVKIVALGEKTGKKSKMDYQDFDVYVEK